MNLQTTVLLAVIHAAFFFTPAAAGAAFMVERPEPDVIVMDSKILSRDPTMPDFGFVDARAHVQNSYLIRIRGNFGKFVIVPDLKFPDSLLKGECHDDPPEKRNPEKYKPIRIYPPSQG